MFGLDEKEAILGWREFLKDDFIICNIHQILLGWDFMLNGVDVICRLHGGDDKYMQRYDRETWRKTKAQKVWRYCSNKVGGWRLDLFTSRRETGLDFFETVTEFQVV